MNLNDLRRRVVSLPRDRDAVLEAHCEGNYESDAPWARRVPYETYRRKWLSTTQPESFLARLVASLQDPRTVADIWEDDAAPVAYLWLVFGEFGGYGIAYAEVSDIWVAAPHRRQGLGRQLLALAEEHARGHGAAVLRSETGIENLPSQALHGSAGFSALRFIYEKPLVPPEDLTSFLDT